MTDTLTPADPLANATLIYVAPRTGTSGVSDYADDVLPLMRASVQRVIEVRCGGAGQDSIADVRAGLAEVRKALRDAAGPVVLHSETSGGALLPFWALTVKEARKPRVVRSATLHDAPLAVWTPFRTIGIGRSRLLVHALHFPTMPLLHRFERRVMRRVRISALTPSGAAAIAAQLDHPQVDVSFLPPPSKPVITPAVERPLAVGLFGYVYRGKGFDSLGELRRLIDDRIEIRVAGRGTKELPPTDGITIVGPVEGAEEDAYFESIRAIVMPYSKRSSYGPTTHVASSVLARAIAYGTPAVALQYPGLNDEAIAVEGGLDQLAATVNELVQDKQRLHKAAEHSLALRDQLTAEAAVSRLTQGWREALHAGE